MRSTECPSTVRWRCWVAARRCVIGVVCIVSALYNVPRWFEYRPETRTSNETNATTLVADRTPLLKDATYVRVYYSWLYLPVMCIVPLVALSTINASLVLAVRRSRADRKRMNVRQCRENNVTLMLVSVVAVFIVCQVRPSTALDRSDTAHYTGACAGVAVPRVGLAPRPHCSVR